MFSFAYTTKLSFRHPLLHACHTLGTEEQHATPRWANRTVRTLKVLYTSTGRYHQNSTCFFTNLFFSKKLISKFVLHFFDWLVNMSLSTLFVPLQRYSATSIFGKRLFSDDYAEDYDQKGTKEQPIPVSDYLHVNFLNNFFLFHVALLTPSFCVASSFFLL